MKQFLVDTNCLISFVTDRNETQQAQIKPFFEKATRAEFELIILPPVKIEFAYVLDKVYKIPKRQIRDILLDLFSTPGIKATTTREDHSELNLWPEKIHDFADAIIAAHPRALNAIILTFDREFAKQLTKLNIKHQLLK